jgi:hypothetical protein
LAIEKITKQINLDLSDVPESRHATVKREVGDYVTDEILRALSAGKSPVVGETFKKLNKEYADEEKGGNRTPNLELDGDMLDALIYKNNDKGIEIGIFSSSEVPKADGHNNFSGDSKLPKRRFIPKDDQKFKREIETGVRSIVNEYKKSTTTSTDPFASILTVEESEERVDIQVGDLFNDDFLEAFLRDNGYV